MDCHCGHIHAMEVGVHILALHSLSIKLELAEAPVHIIVFVQTPQTLCFRLSLAMPEKLG